MILRENLPVGAVGGACYISGRMPGTGEPVIDLELEAEARPSFGRVCVTGEIVKEMAALIGWVEYSPADKERVKLLREHIGDLTAERDALRAGILAIYNAAKLADIDLPGFTADVEAKLDALDRTKHPVAVPA